VAWAAVPRTHTHRHETRRFAVGRTEPSQH
jgi:hypothetical protein